MKPRNALIMHGEIADIVELPSQDKQYKINRNAISLQKSYNHTRNLFLDVTKDSPRYKNPFILFKDKL